ncbi:hypothetical protein FHS51_003833 [Sphingobium wenxiniae]|nr:MULTISPECIES: hypothetical protein [Sphingobium]MBB6193575.1 hypothetical protein [Sphingobium wenxiniae]
MSDAMIQSMLRRGANLAWRHQDLENARLARLELGGGLASEQEEWLACVPARPVIPQW